MPRQDKPTDRRRRTRDEDNIIASARRNAELMRQLEDSLRQEERGDKVVLFRDILAAQREGRST